MLDISEFSSANIFFSSVGQRRKKYRWIREKECSKSTLNPMELRILYIFDRKAHAGNKCSRLDSRLCTSVVTIHRFIYCDKFSKSKTHAITDTYCTFLPHYNALVLISTKTVFIHETCAHADSVFLSKLKEKYGLFVDFEFLTEMGSWGIN